MCDAAVGEADQRSARKLSQASGRLWYSDRTDVIVDGQDYFGNTPPSQSGVQTNRPTVSRGTKKTTKVTSQGSSDSGKSQSKGRSFKT